MRKQLVTLLSAGALAASVLVAGATSANAAGCGLFANTPTRSGMVASGVGGRSGCSSQIGEVKVQLVHYQPWGLHEIKAEAKLSGVTNASRKVSWTRPNTSTANGWDWYTATHASGGQKVESYRVTLWS